MKPTVRTVNLNDIDEIERIADQSGLGTWTHQGYLDEIGRRDSIFLTVATRDGGVSGFIAGRIVPGPDAEIYNIAVAKNARRLGLGLALLRKFISRCKAGNVENIWLEVRRSNSNAISFYKNAGFEEITVRSRFYSNPVEDAVVMKLEVKNVIT